MSDYLHFKVLTNVAKEAELTKKKSPVLSLAYGLFLLFLFSVCSAYAITVPRATTTLTVSPGTTVAAGTILTLTATVSYSGIQQTGGLVSFCDLNVGCSPSNLIGTAWLTHAGVASVKVVLGVGSYNLEAIYSGTQSVPATTSDPLLLTVSGTSNYRSGVTVSANGAPGHYNLTANVSAFGKTAPSGLVSFVDLNSGNSMVASASLDPSTNKAVFVAPSLPGPATGKGSYAVAVGDFNNDGFRDLAVVNGDDSTVSIALGKGNGSFASSTVYQTGAAPVSVAIGDFNGDGFQDLAVANLGASSVSILLGNGDGTFRKPVSYAVGSAPSSLAVADVNLDGVPDIVVANTVDNSISILVGLGDGTFLPATNLATGQGPEQVIIADVNGDGWPDILTANVSDNSISVLLGNGDGTFGSPIAYKAGFEPHSLAAGDLKGDGNLDLVVANYGDNTVSVMLGNGDGTFQPQSIFKVGRCPFQVAIADFNQDGFLDVAVANAMSNSVTVLLGSGDGSFQPPASYRVGTMPTGISVADFNGDGLPDLALVSFNNSGATNVNLLLGQRVVQAGVGNVDVLGNGEQRIVAVYTGDTIHARNLSQPLPVQGIPLLPSISLKSSLNPARLMTKICFTAKLSSNSGTPTGSVTFLAGGKKLETVMLNTSGQAALTLQNLGVGSHAITAIYSGDSRYATTTSPVLNEFIEPARTVRATGVHH
jgi:hypothetical protein